MSSSPRYPDFYVVGAQRSGTTFLYEYLRQHPQVFMSEPKEPHFFSQDRVKLDADLVVRAELDYLRLFAPAGDSMQVGEASPSYLWHPLVAERIQAKQPGAKIIAILRNPIARAYSHYQMDLGDGLPAAPFYDLIVSEYRQGEKVYGTGHLYVELGQYADQIRRYLDTFGSSRVLVLSFHALTTDPRRTLAQVASFLDIDFAPFQALDTFEVQNHKIAPRYRIQRSLLQHRSVRQFYRRLVPRSLRRRVREQIYGPAPAGALDANALEFLQRFYEPELARLEKECGIAFPDLAVTNR